MTNSKSQRAVSYDDSLHYLFLSVWKRTCDRTPVSIRLISSEIVYLIPVLLCLLIGRDSIGKLIPHRAPRISTLLMTILFVLLLEPLMTCLNVFTMLFSTNYVLETRSDLSIISVPLQLICIAVVPAVLEEFMFRGVFAGYYREKGILTAALLSGGLVFGLFPSEFQSDSAMPAFALGVAFAPSEGTGSIFYGMFAHFLINGFSVIITALSDKIPPHREESIAAVAESMTTETLVITFCVYAVIAAVSPALRGPFTSDRETFLYRVPLILRKTGRPGRKRFRRSFSSALSSVWALWYGEIFGHNLGR